MQVPDAAVLKRNVELKARCADLEGARRAAVELGAEHRGMLQQRDTYFNVSTGRLKLRETGGEAAILIWYERPDSPRTRTSRYHLVPVADPVLLSAALEAALGMRGVVEKRRELFLYRNVRIHLDDVAALGTFLEFEAVLAPEERESDAHALLAELREHFGIGEGDLICGSYGELIERLR